jgi:ATP-dependent RNA helicase DeaD
MSGKSSFPQTNKQKLQNKAQKGYRRLFINLGKRDGFYPGELMQTLNRFVGGRQEVGHIDLLYTISYFEVPERDAKKVIIQLTGIRYKGRQVRCNDADEGPKPTKPRKPAKPRKPGLSGLSGISGITGISEMEGWAMRKPRKKK